MGPGRGDDDVGRMCIGDRYPWLRLERRSHLQLSFQRHRAARGDDARAHPLTSGVGFRRSAIRAAAWAPALPLDVNTVSYLKVRKQIDGSDKQKVYR